MRRTSKTRSSTRNATASTRSTLPRSGRAFLSPTLTEPCAFTARGQAKRFSRTARATRPNPGRSWT
ncbi:unnamed protein product [Ectocarpus sp. 13 AM-2016]